MSRAAQILTAGRTWYAGRVLGGSDKDQYRQKIYVVVT